MTERPAPTRRFNLFATQRLLAQRLRASDFDEVYRMNQTAPVMELIGGVRSEAATRDYITASVEHWDRHGFGVWLLRSKVDGALVGRSVLRRTKVDGVDEMEFGYALMPDYWGLGLATEISRAMLEIAFAQLNSEAVVALIAPTNVASRRVAEKLGARYDRDVTHAGSTHALYRVMRNPA